MPALMGWTDGRNIVLKKKKKDRTVTYFACSSQTTVQGDPDPDLSTPRTGGTQETLFFLVQKAEVVPSASR